MQHYLNGDNVGLIIGRQGQVVGSMPWNLAFVTNTITDFNIFYRGGGMSFPLFLYSKKNYLYSIDQLIDWKTNLNHDVIHQIEDKIGLTYKIEKSISTGFISEFFTPIDVFDFIYAILYNSKYRSKFKEFLKTDFPKIPYPKDKDTFWKLVKLGSELRQIHLLESPTVNNFITIYPVSGSNEVGKVKYADEKAWINNDQYFDQVPQIAWEFYIGGYQPAQKWLKDRKGRVLSFDDIMHYQKIIVALSETDRIMKEIDLIDFLE